MTALANWAEAALIDWLLGGASPTRPTTRYLAFHTADPGETGATGELSTGGYARQAITFGGATGTAPTLAANTSTHTFTASGAAWGAVTHLSIWDAITGGNCLTKGALTASRTIADGDSLTVAAAAITLALD